MRGLEPRRERSGSVLARLDETSPRERVRWKLVVGRDRQALPPPGGRPALTSTSAVPDVLAPGLKAIFCGINPGRVSAAAGAHFANPRNDFWRLLHDAGFTPRLLAPDEQWSLPEFGYGLTNAAFRTTRGSGELRRGDFAGAAERLDRLAAELQPRAIAFVGRGLPRRVQGARRARAPEPPSGRDGAVRAAVDLARERGRSLRRAPPLVP